MNKLNLSLPNLNFIGKTLIAVVVILVAVRLTPDSWGIKSWFSAS